MSLGHGQGLLVLVIERKHAHYDHKYSLEPFPGHRARVQNRPRYVDKHRVGKYLEKPREGHFVGGLLGRVRSRAEDKTGHEWEQREEKHYYEGDRHNLAQSLVRVDLRRVEYGGLCRAHLLH